jgi:transcriptional regulator with XRE-family HTH domain
VPDAGGNLGLGYFGIEMPRYLNHARLQQFIGALIHELRLKRKMSQAALGQASAVNRSIISRLEHGHAVSHTVFLRLAAGLGVEEIYFRIGNAGSKSGSYLPGDVSALRHAMLPKQ